MFEHPQSTPWETEKTEGVMPLVSIPTNPIPAGAQAGFVRTRDGIGLRYARWLPVTDRCHGTVCLLQGRAEFIEKYFETVSDLRRRGFAVVTFDWRGQGGSDRLLSDPMKGHVLDFAEYDQDLRTIMTQVALPDSPPPYFALAHSMGSAMALRAAQISSCWFERILLSAPMIRLPDMGKASAGLAMFMIESAVIFGLAERVVPGGQSRSGLSDDFVGNVLTSDYDRFTRNQAVLAQAPHLAIGGPTFGWLHAAITAMKAMNRTEFAQGLRVPILMVSAGNDSVVSNQAIQEFASLARMTRLLDIPGARHEILQERDELREQFFAAFDAFIPGSDKNGTEEKNP